MINQDLTTRQEKLQLCSRCLNHEINSWVNENWKHINDDARTLIMQELKDIELQLGECLVCKNKSVSVKSSEKILQILDENKTPAKIRKEFEQFFC